MSQNGKGYLKLNIIQENEQRVTVVRKIWAFGLI